MQGLTHQCGRHARARARRQAPLHAQVALLHATSGGAPAQSRVPSAAARAIGTWGRLGNTACAVPHPLGSPLALPALTSSWNSFLNTS